MCGWMGYETPNKSLPAKSTGAGTYQINQRGEHGDRVEGVSRRAAGPSRSVRSRPLSHSRRGGGLDLKKHPSTRSAWRGRGFGRKSSRVDVDGRGRRSRRGRGRVRSPSTCRVRWIRPVSAPEALEAAWTWIWTCKTYRDVDVDV